MSKLFEMTRRAKQPIKCDTCGGTIEIGERWYFQREKTESGGWEDSNNCEDCAVFGPPNYSIYELSPLAPDRD